MPATPSSKLIRANWALLRIGKIKILVADEALMSKDTSKCPAIILAANRIAKVNGRIKALIVSISTIKGISTEGVPLGIK